MEFETLSRFTTFCAGALIFIFTLYGFIWVLQKIGDVLLNNSNEPTEGSQKPPEAPESLWTTIKCSEPCRRHGGVRKPENVSKRKSDKSV